MKISLKKGFILILSTVCLCRGLWAVSNNQSGDNSSDSTEQDQAYEDEMDDIDALFEDAEDDEDAEEKDISNALSVFNNKITFWGSFNAKLVWLQEMYPSPSNRYPGASFSSYIGMTIRPYKDLSLQASFQTIFPSMDFTVYTYFLDYNVLGYAFLTLGRTKKSWGNSTIFDTNILDDKATDEYPDASVFLASSTSKPTSYDLIATVPFFKGQIEGIISYESYSETSLSPDFFEGEVLVEYPIGPFSVGFFSKFWNKVAGTHKNNAYGLEFTGDLFDIHLTGWGSINIDFETPEITYARSVIGVSKAWLNNPKMGITCEYEFIYNHQQEDQYDYMHYMGLKYAWSHVGGSVFSPSLQWFMGFNDMNGVIAPSITISVLPHATISFSVPVFYGNQTVNYQGATITSSADKPVILGAAVLSLSGAF